MTEAELLLGYNGRMISGSKSTYRNRYPKHFVLFNANLCTSSLGKIWYGDLDLHLDKNQLLSLAFKLQEDVYVLQEMDGRFENEENPKLERALVIFHPEGRYSIKEQYMEYYSDLENA